MERASTLGGYVKLNSPLADKVKPLCLFTLMKNELPGCKAHVGGATYHQFEIAFGEIREERMRVQDVPKSFHVNNPWT